MEQIQFLEKFTEKFSEFLATLVIYRVQIHYVFMFLIFGFLFITLFVSVQPDSICQKLIILRNFYFLAFAILNLDILYCKLNNLIPIYHTDSEIPLYVCFFIFIILISITVKFMFSIPELVTIPITPILSGLVFVVFYLGVFVKDSYEQYSVVSILSLLTQASLLVFIHLTYLNFNEVRVKYHKLKTQLEKAMARTENVINNNSAQIEFLKKHFCDAIFKTFFSNNFEQTVNRNRLKEIGNTFSTHFDSFYDEAMKAHFFIQKYEQRFKISSIYRIFLIKMENKSLIEIIDIFEEMIEKLSEDFILAESIVHKIKIELYKALFLDSESRHNYIVERIVNCKGKIENVNNYFQYNELWEPRRLFEHMSSINEDEENSIEKVIDDKSNFWIENKKKSKRTSSFTDIREQVELDAFNQPEGRVSKQTLPRNFSFESSIRLRERPVVNIRDLEEERIKLEKYQEEIDGLNSKIVELKSQFDESLRLMILKDSIEKDLNEINSLMTLYLKLVELYDELEGVLKNCKSKLLKIGFLCE